MMPESSSPKAEPLPAVEIRPADEKTTDAAAGHSESPLNGASTMGSDGLDMAKNVLNDHKGKLAIGVAATLGLMVYYKWREKNLAKEDPEEYARLQRFKSVVKDDAGDKWDEDE